MRSQVPTLKGPEASLLSVQCFLYLVSSSTNVSIFHIKLLDTFWTDYVHVWKKEELDQTLQLQVGKKEIRLLNISLG